MPEACQGGRVYARIMASLIVSNCPCCLWQLDNCHLVGTQPGYSSLTNLANVGKARKYVTQCQWMSGKFDQRITGHAIIAWVISANHCNELPEKSGNSGFVAGNEKIIRRYFVSSEVCNTASHSTSPLKLNVWRRRFSIRPYHFFFHVCCRHHVWLYLLVVYSW